VLTLTRILGNFCTRLRQPRVIGEILAGVLLGPSLLGHFAPSLALALLPQGTSGTSPYGTILAFLYNFGLLLLMFASGAETKGLFSLEHRRAVAWLCAVCTVLLVVLG